MKHGYNLIKNDDRNIHFADPTYSKYTDTHTHIQIGSSPISNGVQMSLH